MAGMARATFCPGYACKPLKRLEKAAGETSNAGLKSGANEKTHLLHVAEQLLYNYRYFNVLFHKNQEGGGISQGYRI